MLHWQLPTFIFWSLSWHWIFRLASVLSVSALFGIGASVIFFHADRSFRVDVFNILHCALFDTNHRAFSVARYRLVSRRPGWTAMQCQTKGHASSRNFSSSPVPLSCEGANL